MEISAETVRRERQQRGWTQQHLADAAGCSLRTIQRIEKHGVASNESVSALCAVFEIERDRLLAEEATSRSHGSKRPVAPLLAAAAAVGAGLGAGLTWLAMSFAAAS
ncbi:MAG: helix-turn-helix domain-containing protein [Gammaproteobacteria bacterium]|jgi:transcriptional regulator with XRE-family HTH domain|nr:helix-turn-helix domain-containing protein [Gammaproteobacteria bacterium]